MNKFSSLIVFLITAPLLLHAQHEQKIRMIELNGDFGGNYKIEYNGKFSSVPQHGFGINTTLGSKYGGLFGSYTYRLTDISSLVPGSQNPVSHEIYVGSRYYPMIPTFLVGPAAVRLTGTAAFGFDWNFDLRLMYQAGIEISPVRTTIGVTIQFFNSLGKFNTGDYQGKSFWALRLGLMIGPSMN